MGFIMGFFNRRIEAPFCRHTRRGRSSSSERTSVESIPTSIVPGNGRYRCGRATVGLAGSWPRRPLTTERRIRTLATAAPTNSSTTHALNTNPCAPTGVPVVLDQQCPECRGSRYRKRMSQDIGNTGPLMIGHVESPLDHHRRHRGGPVPGRGSPLLRAEWPKPEGQAPPHSHTSVVAATDPLSRSAEECGGEKPPWLVLNQSPMSVQVTTRRPRRSEAGGKVVEGRAQPGPLTLYRGSLQSGNFCSVDSACQPAILGLHPLLMDVHRTSGN